MARGSAGKSRGPGAAAPAVILGVTVLVYLRCLGNGFVSDDRELLLKNPYIKQWSFLWWSAVRNEYWFLGASSGSPYYRPLQDWWMWFGYHLFGLNPAPWHATMVAIHLVAVWLVFKIAIRLTGSQYAAAVASVLFALVPLHAEAVAWQPGIDVLQSGAFELAAFYFFIRSDGTGRYDWLVSMLFFGCALLTHESAVTFPGFAALYVLLLQPPGATPSADSARWARMRRMVVRTAPFAAEVVLYLAARRFALGFTIHAAGTMGAMSTTQALLTTPLVVARYGSLLILPWSAALHRVLPVKSPGAPEFYLPLLGLAAVAAVLLLLLRVHPRRRLYMFCIAWAALAILPAMNLRGLNPDYLVCDRYLYLPSVGWFLLAGDLAGGLAARSALTRLVVSAGAAALLVMYGISLWKVQHVWHDDYTVFKTCIDNFPESGLCHSRLGLAVNQAGDFAGARREFKQALALDLRDNPLWYADTLYSLGEVDAKLGHVNEATAEIAEALERKARIEGADIPGTAYTLLAELYDQVGQPARSQATLKYAQTRKDGAEAADLARARIAWRHGDNAGAEVILHNLTRNYPSDPRVWVMLGLAMEELTRNQEALAAYERALSINSYDARTRLFMARTLHAMGRDREALAECRSAQDIAPNDANARALMAQIQQAIDRQ